MISGAAATLVLLDPKLLGPDLGWRLCFGLAVLLALVILLVRRNVPESLSCPAPGSLSSTSPVRSPVSAVPTRRPRPPERPGCSAAG